MANLIKTKIKIKLWDGLKVTINKYDNGSIEEIKEKATEQEILDELNKVNFDINTTNQIKQKNQIAIN